MNTLLNPTLFISAAQPLVGRSDPAFIKRLLREVNAKPSQRHWDAAFAHHVGYWSHYSDHERRSTWTLPATASVEELAQACGTSGILRGRPMPGDLFLLHDKGTKKFVRTGIITQVTILIKDSDGTVYDCNTIEGDSTHDSVGGKPCVLRHRRTLSSTEFGDQFIRWTGPDEQDGRLSVSEFEYEDAHNEALEYAPQWERAA